mmetsp:Transcript_51566/g.81859  ORF Transcript_51566/g.81859 Transcript_51566/m.81859 type:complete len:976 (-) Transcript_51566:151-3078(-)
MAAIAYRDVISYPPAVTRIFERLERIEPLLAHRGNLKHPGLTRLAPLLAPDPTPYDGGQADFRHPHKRGRGRRHKVGGCQYSHASLPPPQKSHSSLPPLHGSNSENALAQTSLESSGNGGPMQPAPPLVPRAMPPRPPVAPSSALLAAGVYSASIVPGMPGKARRRRPAPNVVLRRSPSPEADHPCWPQEGGKFPEYYCSNMTMGTSSTSFLRGLYKQFLEPGTEAAAATEAAEARQLKREEDQRRKDAERRKEAARRDKLVDRLAADLQKTTAATYTKRAEGLQTLHESADLVKKEETCAAAPVLNAVGCRFNMSPSVGTWITVSPTPSRPGTGEQRPAMLQDLAENREEQAKRREPQIHVKVNFNSLDPEQSRTKVRSELTKAFQSGVLDAALREMMHESSPRPTGEVRRAVLDGLYIGALRYFQDDKFRRSTDSWRSDLSAHSSLDGRPLGEDYVASLKDESSVSGDWEIEHEVFAGDFIHHCFDHALDEAVGPLLITPAEAITPVQAESPNEAESACLVETPTLPDVGDIAPQTENQEYPKSPSRERERRELEELRAENAKLRQQLAAPTSTRATTDVSANAVVDSKLELGELRQQACVMLQQAAVDGSLQTWLTDLGKEKSQSEKTMSEHLLLEEKVLEAEAELRSKRQQTEAEIERQRQLEARRKAEADKAEVDLARQRLQVEEDFRQHKQKAEERLAEELEQHRKRAEEDIEGAKQRALLAADERRASEEADLKRKVMKSQMRSHFMESYWNGHLAEDLVPICKQQHNFEPLRAQTRDMVAAASMDGSLQEALKKIFGVDATAASPKKQRRDPRKIDFSASTRLELTKKSPVAWETKSSGTTPRTTPSPPLSATRSSSKLSLKDQRGRRPSRPTPPSLVPFAEYYKMAHCMSNVCQGIAHALFPRIVLPPSQATESGFVLPGMELVPRSPDVGAPQRRRPKGTALMLNSLETGGASNIIDDEESEDGI